MRILITLSFLFTTFFIKSQAPQLINYQAVARDGSGNIVTTSIGLKFQIYQGSVSGTLVYEETNTSTPSSAGIFTVHIGGGTPVSGNFNTINWAGGPYFLQVNIDPAGGTSYSAVGAHQLVSVPYALFAEKAGNAVIYTSGNGIAVASGSITNTAPDQTVNINAAGIATVTSAYPNFSVSVGPPALTYNSGTKELTLTQGGTSSTATLTGTGSNTVSIIGTGVANVTPAGAGSNFTVNVPSPIISGGGATTVMGVWPNFTVTTPFATNYVGGTGISVTGSVITNTAPNQTVNITGTGPITVSGGYPNYTISAPIPTVTPAPVITGAGISTVTTVGSSYTVNTASLNLSYMPTTGVLTYAQGAAPSSINISPALSFNNSTLTIGSNTTLIPGTGLWSRSSNTATTLFNTSDNVGIGTSNPLQKLDVIGYIREGAGPATADEGWLLFTPSPGLSILRAGGRATSEMRLDQSNNAPMSFWTNGTEKMRVLSTGEVGIGITTPTQKLHVNNGSALVETNPGQNSILLQQGSVIANNSSGSTSRFVNAVGGVWTWGAGVTNTGNSDYHIVNYPASRFDVTVLSSNGRVGIGTTTPSNKLHVNGGVTITDGTQGFNKVLTSDATGNGKWDYPLTPTKEGNYGGFFYLANSTNYTYNSATVLTFTPATSGIVVFNVFMDYNFDYSLPSQVFCGIHVNTTGTAPGTATPFTASVRTGIASGAAGAAYGDIPVSFGHSMSVVAGTTYYVWIGGKGVNFNQTNASIGTTKIIVTLHQASGL